MSAKKEIIEKPSCPICCETFNKSTKKCVSCDFCKYDACKTCYETFLLQDIVAKCMNCKEVFTRKMLREKMTDVFLENKYKKHLEDVQVKFEEEFFPSTQIIIEREKVIEEIRNENLNYEKQILLLQHEMFEIQRKIRENNNNIYALHYQKSTEIKKFTYKCPNQECRGYVDEVGKCSLCNKFVCLKCFEIINAEENKESEKHKCVPENVKTISLLKKDTKTCPKCSAYITKIDGCDQMWCVNCHTAFSWTTGKIETKIHNPHYYEWQRKTKGFVEREIEQQDEQQPPQCGGQFELTQNVGINIVNNVRKMYSSIKSQNLKYSYFNGYLQNKNVCENEFDNIPLKILSYYNENLIHNVYEEIPRLNVEERRDEINLHPRKMYLKNFINNDEFKKQVQRNNKKNDFNKEIRDIILLHNQICKDIFERLQIFTSAQIDNFMLKKTSHSSVFSHPIPSKDSNDNNNSFNEENFINELRTIMNEFVEANKYCNELLIDLQRVYKLKTKTFNNLLKFTNKKMDE
jgi:hypothetical protein